MTYQGDKYRGILHPDVMTMIRRLYKSGGREFSRRGETFKMTTAKHPAFILVRGDKGTTALIGKTKYAGSKLVNGGN
jgi:hypothetical protein